ncbi:hypothetical protein ACFY4C_39665 [Actinomadura viridis]|uniref:hypothetical protein n=1 Tax=Actinomadura viridis TaxID=58110 RepID=UPI00369120DD
MALYDQIAMLAAALDDGLLDREHAARLLTEHAQIQMSTTEALDRLDSHRGLPSRDATLLADLNALLHALNAVKQATTTHEAEHARLRLETELALQQERIHERARARAWDLLRCPARPTRAGSNRSDRPTRPHPKSARGDFS